MTLSKFIARTAGFADGSDSPVAVLEEGLDRIAAREAELHCFMQIDIDTARAEAEAAAARWRNGTPLSVIDGMALGIKDIIETREFPTGQGSPTLPPIRTGRDSATVQALRSCGGIVLGKTVTTEFASTELFYDTRNPHDTRRTPGGSSSGSAAAVGAGYVPLALGSQVVGSTIRPASYNGAYGYKPSYGALNRGGSYDILSQSAVGLIAASLEDIWVPARLIASRVGGDPGHVGLLGPDELPPASKPASLVVLQTAGWSHRTPGAAAAFARACDQLEAMGIRMIGRDDDPRAEAAEQALAGAMPLTWTIMAREFVWPLAALTDQNPDWVSPPMRARLAAGRETTQAAYAEALTRREAVRDTYRALMADHDAVITLGATGCAPVGFETTGNPEFNVPASLLGCPAVTLPVLQDEGLPLGLQVMGATGGDARMMAVAAWIDAALGRDGDRRA